MAHNPKEGHSRTLQSNPEHINTVEMPRCGNTIHHHLLLEPRIIDWLKRKAKYILFCRHCHLRLRKGTIRLLPARADHSNMKDQIVKVLNTLGIPKSTTYIMAANYRESGSFTLDYRVRKGSLSSDPAADQIIDSTGFIMSGT